LQLTRTEQRSPATQTQLNVKLNKYKQVLNCFHNVAKMTDFISKGHVTGFSPTHQPSLYDSWWSIRNWNTTWNTIHFL